MLPCSLFDRPRSQLHLTVVGLAPDCPRGYRLGDVFTIPELLGPDERVCTALAHAAFPVLYALASGAKFRAQENQRSLVVGCPDRGRVRLQVQVSTDGQQMEFVPRDPAFEGPAPQAMSIEVVESNGKCAYGYVVGQRWTVNGLKCLDGFCGAAYHLLFPALFALNFRAELGPEAPGTTASITCPDNGNVSFRVSRAPIDQ